MTEYMKCKKCGSPIRRGFTETGHRGQYVMGCSRKTCDNYVKLEIISPYFRDGVRNYERAIVQARNSEDPDSDVRLVMARDLQIIELHGPETGDCIEKQWDFHGTMMTKTELKACKERFLVRLGELELMGID